MFLAKKLWQISDDFSVEKFVFICVPLSHSYTVHMAKKASYK